MKLFIPMPSELSAEELLKGNTQQFGKLMNDHWQKKKNRSKNMSNNKINEIYDLATKNGALGGKLVEKTNVSEALHPETGLVTSKI